MATVNKCVTKRFVETDIIVFKVEFTAAEFEVLTKLLGRTSTHDLTTKYNMNDGEDKVVEEIYRTFSDGR